MLTAGGDLLVVRGELGCLGAGDADVAHDAHDAHGMTLQGSLFCSRGAKAKAEAEGSVPENNTSKDEFRFQFSPQTLPNRARLSRCSPETAAATRGSSPGNRRQLC